MPKFTSLSLAQNNGFTASSTSIINDEKTARFQFAIPEGENSITIDRYINGSYIGTSTNTGTIDFGVALVANVTNNATSAQIGFSTSQGTGGPFPSTNSSSYTVQIQYPLSEQDIINITNNTLNNTLNSQFDSRALNWWNTEVRPELERIAKAAEDAEKHFKDIEAHLDKIEDHLGKTEEQISRMRDLSDPNIDGSGIRTISPYGYLGNAILYQLYVKQAQILEDPAASSEDQATALEELKSVINELFSTLGPDGIDE